MRDLDPLTLTKLWDNPCWLSFRLNFVAFRFNDPVYRWIETRYGLVRPEFVALYAVGLKDGVAAKNIVSSSGLPKNTLSRAIQKLLQRRLLKRETDRDDLRSYVLRLTTGRARHLRRDDAADAAAPVDHAFGAERGRAEAALRADGQARHRLLHLARRSRTRRRTRRGDFT